MVRVPGVIIIIVVIIVIIIMFIHILSQAKSSLFLPPPTVRLARIGKELLCHIVAFLSAQPQSLLRLVLLYRVLDFLRHLFHFPFPD